MKKMIMLLCVFGLLATLSGCASLTDAANRRADPTLTDADLQLRQDVMNRLQQDAMTSRHAIGVDARNGAVTLYGPVPDDLTRHRVLTVVRGTPGAVSIHDRLTR